MQFRCLEQSYVGETLHDEGKVITWHPPRDANGKPLMRISENLEPVDDEAKAYKDEADAHFAELAAAKAASDLSHPQDLDEIGLKVHEQLAPLLAAMRNVKFTQGGERPSPGA